MVEAALKMGDLDEENLHTALRNGSWEQQEVDDDDADNDGIAS